MKPESLKTPDTDQNPIKTFFLGVEISYKRLYNIIRSEGSPTFTIKTNKNEYKCSKYGIYSSNVLRDLLNEDPSLNEYIYNYDDEFGEFQLICDLFNFENVILTKSNMDSIKEIAEELEITFILSDVEKFINSSEKVSQAIDEHQTIIDSIENLFYLLYNIKEKTVKTVKTAIIESEWSKTEEKVKELAAFIIQVVKSDILLHQDIVELLI